MQDPPRIVVHVNPGSGNERVQPEQLRARLGPHHVGLVVEEPAAIVNAASAAVARRDALFCVAGGDGTIHGVANVLAGSDTALACIPTGTINSFARRLCIDSVATAAQALSAHNVRTIAVGVVNDRVFLNTLTLGEYARVVRMRDRLRPFVGKWPGALVGFTVTAMTLRRMRISLTAGEEQIVRRTPFMWVGIGWGSFPRVDQALERRERPDLEVAIVRPARTVGTVAFMVRTGFRILRGRTPVHDRHLEILQTRSFEVQGAHRIDATVDGEATRIRPPIRVAVHDAALRVVVGPGYDET